MGSQRSSSPASLGVARGALVVGALCSAWIALVLLSSGGSPSVPNSQTVVFGAQPNAAEMWIAKADGVHFAQLATDPLYRNTIHNFRGDAPRAGYRSLRPVQGWVDWAASLGGRQALLAPAILALTVVTIAMLPVAASLVAAALGRVAHHPLLVLTAPGVIASLWAPGMCEPLATGVVLAGVGAWLRDRRWLGVTLFCVAALTRETTLAVPAGIALADVFVHRRLRPSLPLLCAPAAYAVWATFVAWRVGPVVSDVATANGWQPLTGLIEASSHWSAGDVLALVVVVAHVVLLLRLREPVLTGIALTHVAMMACFGSPVWANWWGFGRVVLPLGVLVLVGRRLDEATTNTSTDETVRTVPATV